MFSGVSTSLPCQHIRFHPGRSVFDVTHASDPQLLLARRPWAIRVGVAASNAVMYLLSVFRGEVVDDLSGVNGSGKNGEKKEAPFTPDDALRMLRFLSPHTLLFDTQGEIKLVALPESYEVPVTADASLSPSTSIPSSPISVQSLRWQGPSICNRTQDITPSTLEQSCLHSLALTVFEAYTSILPFSEATAQHAAEMVSGGGEADITALTATDDSLGAIVAQALRSSRAPIGGGDTATNAGFGNGQAILHFRDLLIKQSNTGDSSESATSASASESSEGDRSNY